MAARQLARRRVLTGCLVAGALAVAGCTAAAQTTSVTGSKLTIYLSDPAGLASDQQAQDVIGAERLAFSQLKGQVSAFRVALAGPLTAGKISDNARTAVKDSSAIAYLGEVTPGTSADSVGITNALDLLQVTPTDTAAALTQKTAVVPGSPGHYYESFATYGHTLARLVPSTGHEAVALASEMKSLGIHTLRLTGDGSDYGRGLAAALTSNLPAASITLQPAAAGSDAVLFAGNTPGQAATVLNQAVAANPKVKLFVPSALADPGFVAALNPAARRVLYASEPAPGPGNPGSGTATFASAFRSAYGHAPSPPAIFGYAAMQAIMRVLAQAGSQANNRDTVVKDFMRLRYVGSVLGSYTIDGQGDTSFDTFAILHVNAGRLGVLKVLPG